MVEQEKKKQIGAIDACTLLILLIPLLQIKMLSNLRIKETNSSRTKTSAKHSQNMPEHFPTSKQLTKSIACQNKRKKKWKLSEQQKAQIQDLKHSIYLNQALIFLKKKNWGRADIKANLALKIKKTAKGLFRRAKARVQTNDPQGAIDDLKQARTLDPGNQEIVEELAKVRARMPQILKKQSQMFDLYKNQKKKSSEVEEEKADAKSQDVKKTDD